jgi:hypothetical protein
MSFLDDPRHWCEWALQARGLTLNLDDANIRNELLRVAERYDRMAIRAETRAAITDTQVLSRSYGRG